MTQAFRRAMLTILLAFLAAVAGVLIGGNILSARPSHGTELHALLHREITLDVRQEVALDELEARFATLRTALEGQLRADNVRLAAAIEREHDNGPAVAAAVDRSHHTMGALQKATLAHVFAMRRLMRSDQTAAFDRVVVQALTPSQ
ncbi:periplasmic heavy metal sensor [Sphingomonas sp. Leaf38]|uniref:periplasmic heavy metal sensor n=1 Tax=Sphingomonas sp. Leaf38 TaxID=1736217 RepID=UPI0007014FEF|nr:periplasmic heavy metal sensor [Sphingomonas sp. Leaf38]KQN28683.1 heavy metal resistance protein [Sphingomonas sp. Leaf38]